MAVCGPGPVSLRRLSLTTTTSELFTPPSAAFVLTSVQQAVAISLGAKNPASLTAENSNRNLLSVIFTIKSALTLRPWLHVIVK